MARRIKTNADYFSHDADASSDEKLIYLESLYGHKGYSFYFKMLEILTRSNYFEIELNEITTLILSKKMNFTLDEFKEILQSAILIKAFKLKNNRLSSEGLIKRFKPLIDKRERDRIKYEPRKDIIPENNKIIFDVENKEKNEFSTSKTPIEEKRKEEKRKEKYSKEEYIKIISYLNEKTNSKYRHDTQSTQKHINARMNEGFSLEDFKTVIDKKTAEWINDPKMSQYLRPETLFGTKFENYLNQKIGNYYGNGRKTDRGTIALPSDYSDLQKMEISQDSQKN